MEKDWKKALIEYEGGTYWIDLSGNVWEVKTFKDGKLTPTRTSEVNLADLLWKGHVISREKPA